MGETSIQWTDYTFNPWQGCQRVSPGCVNCYAEARDVRFNRGKHWGPQGTRARTSAETWRKPLAWNAKAKEKGTRYRVFCASIADVFEDRPELLEWRRELFGLIASTPDLDWLLLTKRPENIRRLWPETITEPGGAGVNACPPPGATAWPNVWIGTTVEDQRRANERIPELLKVSAAVRFLSVEPLLEAVQLPRFCLCGCGKTVDAALREPSYLNSEQREDGMRVGLGVDWVIIGGESGRWARPFNVEWARDLVKQCRTGGAKPFVKQMGDRPIISAADLAVSRWRFLDERTQNWTRFLTAAGGDPADWPEDLRVREFPAR